MFKKNSINFRFLTGSGGDTSRRGFFSGLMLVVFMLGLAGCQTIPALPPVNLSEPGWTIHEGQAVWRSKKDAPEIAGELLVAVNPDGRSFVQFTKTPLPFIVAQTTINSWQIHFVPNNRTYSARTPSGAIAVASPDPMPRRRSAAEKMAMGVSRCRWLSTTKSVFRGND